MPDNLDAALTTLEGQIDGATLLSAVDQNGQGIALIRLTTGRTYRLTFSGGVDTLPTNEGVAYHPISDEAATKATIGWAGWDDNWLIIAQNGTLSLHIRLYGDLLAFEEV